MLVEAQSDVEGDLLVQARRAPARIGLRTAQRDDRSRTHHQ
jgi:hypothetical protein